MLINYDSIPVFIYLSFVHAHAICGSECNWKKLKLKYENLLKLDIKKNTNALAKPTVKLSFFDNDDEEDNDEDKNDEEKE